MSRHNDSDPTGTGTEPTGDDADGGVPPSLLDQREALADRLASARGLLVCSDFDGTLAAITDEPGDATIRPESREALAALVDRPRVTVAVVTGRELADIESRVDIEGVTYAGNHGLEIERTDGRLSEEPDGGGTERVVHPVADRRREELSTMLERLSAAFDDLEGAFVEDKGVTATVHYRLLSEDEARRVEETVHEVVEAVGGDRFTTTPGKEIVEIRPTLPWDKGSAVGLLAESHPSGWLAVYFGDDRSDEAAFEELAPDGVSVHVGPGESTVADYRVEGPEEVTAVLEWFLAEGLDRLGADAT